MYLRFVASVGRGRGGMQGAFCAAGDLVAFGSLLDCERELLRETLNWFNANLRVPERSVFGCLAECWFKEDAHECIDRMWLMAWILHEHERPVRMLRTQKPFRVSYEDEHQVVAVCCTDMMKPVVMR